jgi:hypothetical protein
MADEELFSVPPDWQKHWQGMPEFVQGKREPYAKIIVRFASEEDLQDFAKRIGQNLNRKTICIWHPTYPRGIKRPVWKDESSSPDLHSQ